MLELKWSLVACVAFIDVGSADLGCYRIEKVGSQTCFLEIYYAALLC